MESHGAVLEPGTHASNARRFARPASVQDDRAVAPDSLMRAGTGAGDRRAAAARP
jgi:hypothetical protein